MLDIGLLYSPQNRTRALGAAAALVAIIASTDWLIKPNFSLNFLYLFPIMLAGGFLSRWQIGAMGVCCAILGELFSPFPQADAATRMAMMSVAFTGTGLFVSELVHKRQLVVEHLQALTEQVRHREDAEQQIQILIESSPAAIVTVDSFGSIDLANQAAWQLLSSGHPLAGEPIRNYLPALEAVARGHRSQAFRTTMQCKGQRRDGEVFLAAIWFSTYKTLSGPKLAAIIVDLSEDLRDREDLSLNHLLKNTRILMGAMSHEIRNLCGAVSAVGKNLARVDGLTGNQDFKALETLIQGLEKIAALELQSSPEDQAMAVDVTDVLDELRVLIEPSFRDAGMTVAWQIAPGLPLVWADSYGLLQVFLNLARNGQRALENCARQELTIMARAAEDSVVIRFEDTGSGVPAPQQLFRPFQPGADGTGLGLYVSRAIVRGFRGELRYEARTAGSCFAVVLAPLIEN
ncbi:MAG TPA: ATP-binding protein [Bryobacteraceae bacterium]|jgi:signal transduction histidine kinase|nr:ATP-binding protein [Bryobacteraceae bacterium]